MQQAGQKMRETAETRPKSATTVSEEVGSILRTKGGALSQKSRPLGVAKSGFSLGTQKAGTGRPLEVPSQPDLHVQFLTIQGRFPFPAAVFRVSLPPAPHPLPLSKVAAHPPLSGSEL